TVTIGSNAKSSNSLTLEAGNGGQLTIGNSDVAHTINIGAAGSTTDQIITIGSTSGASSTTIKAGSGNITLNGNTDVTASVATKAGTTFTSPGTSNNAALNGSSFYLLDTSGTAQVINGITAGRDGQHLTLTNVDASLTVTLTNNSPSATGSKIITGTGSDLV